MASAVTTLRRLRDRVRQSPRAAVCLGLTAAIVFCYWPVSHNSFILLDDPEHVSENPFIAQGLSWEGVRWAFTSANAGFWMPVAWVSSMADWTLFGSFAPGHHWSNVLFHVVNTLLLFRFVRRATGQFWPAGFVAALFALHPLQVESVAWAAERKNVLSTTFWFLCLNAYTTYAANPSWPRYLPVFAWMALSLATKQMGVTIPCVLLLLDYWPLERFAKLSAANGAWRAARRLFVEKLPLFGLSAAASYAAARTQADVDAMMDRVILPIWARFANAAWSYAEYLGKLFWPDDLAIVYPHPYVSKTLTTTMIVVGCLVVVLGSAASIWQVKRRPYLFVGWFWFLGTLIPAIGLVQVGNQGLADRFMYVPIVGILVVIAFAAAELVAQFPKCAVALGAAAVMLLTAGGLKTRAQTALWHDNVTIFEHSLRVAEHELIHQSMATHYMRLGQEDAALRHLERALEMSPTFAIAHHNIGTIYRRRGDDAAAANHWEKALELRPNFEAAQIDLMNVLRDLNVPESEMERLAALLQPWMRTGLAEVNRGVAAYKNGRYEEAIQVFENVLREDPYDANTMVNLGMTLIETGAIDAAIEKFRAGLALQPQLASAENGWGMALARRGDDVGAALHFRRAIDFDKRSADPHYNLGNVELRKGNPAEALTHYRRALELRPLYAKVYLNAGTSLERLGQTAEAEKSFQKAVEIDPKSFEIRFALASRCFQQNRIDASLPHFRAAVEAAPRHAEARFFYGCALAQSGLLLDAREQFENALPLVGTSSPMAEQIRQNLSRIDALR